jgi:hypothetical protein
MADFILSHQRYLIPTPILMDIESALQNTNIFLDQFFLLLDHPLKPVLSQIEGHHER